MMNDDMTNHIFHAPLHHTTTVLTPQTAQAWYRLRNRI